MTRKYYATDMNKAMFVGFMRQLHADMENKTYEGLVLRRGLTLDRFTNWEELMYEDTNEYRTIEFDARNLTYKTKYVIVNYLLNWGFEYKKEVV